MDLENERVLEAVLNKKPYDKKEFEDDLYLEPKQEVKDKRMTSWRTAISIALSVYIMFIGVTNIVNIIMILTQITKDTTGYQFLVFLYSLQATVYSGLGGAPFAIGLISAIKGNETKKAVTILLIIAACYLIVYNLGTGIYSVHTALVNAVRDKANGWTDGYYTRIIPSIFVSLISDVLWDTALLLLVIFAHKKLGNNIERFRQVY